MDIKFITKSVTVTRGLPEQIERIQKLEKENWQLREAMVEIVYLIGDSDRRQEIMDIAKPYAIQHLATLKEKE